MIRMHALALSGAFALIFGCFCAATAVAAPSNTTSTKTTVAKDSKAKDTKAKSKTDSKKSDGKKKDAKDSDHKGGAKPVQVGSFGDWGAFLAQSGKEKTCYALASPKDRVPSGLPRDPAYVFISNRPAENVRNEISIIMGFPMKDGAEARAEVGNLGFDLVAKGPNAWVKNPAEEGQFIEAMKKSAKLVVKAPSIKGNVTTDNYSLTGFSQALDKVQKECP
ncbi:invasion associated locus B family protein [Methyloferula stellata]|uniref:invasion associated locus B family protein n=1 Tax=Methyloferula stellata TaxID=876270 RepID=UPI000369143B|nr:invasion associated locus B family protein [Methyloferula stellata]